MKLEKMGIEQINSNIYTEWFSINGTDFGTDYKFIHEIVGLSWVANSFTIVESDNYPITEGDLRWIAIKNQLTKYKYLTETIS